MATRADPKGRTKPFRSGSRSRSPSRHRPISPARPPPMELLASKDNTVAVTVVMKAQPMGHAQDVVQQLGLQIISKAALMQHEITSVNEVTGEVHRLDDAVFIGGKIAKLSSLPFSEATLVNGMTIWLN